MAVESKQKIGRVTYTTKSARPKNIVDVWNDFFLSKERVSDDFMTNRPIAPRSERLSFDNDECKNQTI